MKTAEQTEKQNHELLLEHVQLEQKCEGVQKQIDKKRETEAILPIERKSSLKAMLLEMQIETMTERHQKAQVKLWVALAFRQADKTAAKNLKELVESKHGTYKALKQDMSQDLKDYDELEKKVTVMDTSVKQCFPRSDMIKSTKNTSDEKKLEDLMEQLKALCISEDDNIQENKLHAGAKSRQ
ncbi:dynein regulatory complex subunit 4-like isoform X4 [Scomber scombrus]